MFTSDRVKMGEFVNATWLKILAYLVAFVIAGLNAWLLWQTFQQLARADMYHRILVPVENSSYDERILDHVRQLAQYCGASIVLIHVADGWAARNIRHLNLRESEEMRDDREYIERLAVRRSTRRAGSRSPARVR